MKRVNFKPKTTSTATKTTPPKNKLKKTKRQFPEAALRVSLVIIFFALIISTVLRGYSVYKFFSAPRTPLAQSSNYKYDCRSPKEGEDEYAKAAPYSKSFSSNKLTSDLLTENLFGNGDLREADSSNPPRPLNLQSSYYGEISARHSYENKVENNSRRFVRVDVEKSAELSGAGWIPSTSVSANGKNGFLFIDDYRSNVVTYLTAELTNSSGMISYQSLGRLAPTQNWQTFTSRFIVPKDTTTLRVYHVLTVPGYLETSNYKLYYLENKLTEPVISINFDDGWKSIYDNAFPVMKQYGVTSSQFIVADYLDNTQLYMTREQISEMQAAGHEVGAHSLKHCDLARLGQTDLTYDTQSSKSILETNFGYISGLAYPFGSHSSRTNNYMKQMFEYTRTTEPGYNDYYFDPYGIKVQNISQDTDINKLEAWIADAKANNLWLVLVYHQVEPSQKYGISPSDFEQHIKIISESGIKVSNMKDAMLLIAQAN